MKPYKAEDLPPVSSWRDRFHYNPDTGVFTFAKSARRGWTGKAVGTLTKKGYLVHKLNGAVAIHVHRLIWAWVTGEWPGELLVIDHVNRNPIDNRWVNLRAASYQQNEANSRPKNRKGNPKGVKFHAKGRGRWEARIMVDYKQIYLGLYDTPEEAAAVYYAEALRLFGPDWATKE